MKKLLLLPLLVLISACSSVGVPDGELLTNVLNTVIKSDAVQNASFVVTDGCTPSVINDIEFCDLLETKYSYTEGSLDQACVDICVGYRATCKTACDVCCGWACNCSSCKSGCDNDYKKCADGCTVFDITGGYDFKLQNVVGLGGMVVKSVSDPKATDVDNVSSIEIVFNIPEVTANAYYKIWQDPIPAMSGNVPVIATNVPVTAQASLIDKCGDGYYLHINSLDIQIPSNIYDSNALLEIIEIMGMTVEVVTDGIVDLNKMLLDFTNDFLDQEVIDILNGVLDDYQIAPSACLPSE